MLVLSRRQGESLILEFEGQIAEVKILGRRGQLYQIGIQAPQTVTVDRKEVHEAKKKEWDK